MPSSKEEKQTDRFVQFVEQLQHLIVLAQAILASAIGQKAAYEVRILGKVFVAKYIYVTSGNQWTSGGS